MNRHCAATIVRVLLAVLLLACTLPLRAQQAPAYASIDHVEFYVADLERALAFYTQVFGAQLWKDNGNERRYLQLGQSYIALEERAEAGIERICFGVENFDLDAAHNWLEAQRIPWQDIAASQGLYVDDRDGIRTQLAQVNTWERLVGTNATRESRPDRGTPIFEAYAIDEVFLSVTNLEVDSLFYSRLLDQTGMLQAGSLWFKIGGASRLRLTQAPVGQKAGVGYFAVHVAYTDMEAAAEAVFDAGGIIENILPNGFSFWDPDGIRVVVRSGDLY